MKLTVLSPLYWIAGCCKTLPSTPVILLCTLRPYLFRVGSWSKSLELTCNGCTYTSMMSEHIYAHVYIGAYIHVHVWEKMQNISVCCTVCTWFMIITFSKMSRFLWSAGLAVYLIIFRSCISDSFLIHLCPFAILQHWSKCMYYTNSCTPFVCVKV